METTVSSTSGSAKPSAVVASPPAPPSSPSPSISSSLNYFDEIDAAAEEEATHCTICNDPLSTTPINNNTTEVETPTILPCGHIFGSNCITRWLNNSTHQNCPICRRRMTYRSCHHVVKPLPVEVNPKLVREQDMPEKCLLCREGGEVLREKMRWVKERMDAEVRALEGLRVLRMTRGFAAFGGLFCGANGPIEDFEGRVDESKRVWEDECRRLEERVVGGRAEW
ncbi:uncharacterized protein PAC_08920 [Phialocephala subalpina]|uniref:RING-type E3 ubiquitin transferase n=1 Tax=Phialocephala subalpina TaxID=576137 RepID=A0A1L7X1Y6_9HELO|nr:uncharacterized protein PAC_08920 [Phialocephala subalpina]